MSYFECIIGSGSATAIPLIVTCSASFAGNTITCTDGTTTLTDTCPSSSPYEITFELPNDGSWTVSGEISGTTYSESILIQPYNVELITNVDITVDFYSAANDTVSYIGIDGQSHTIVTDSSGHASATITIAGQGSSLTFTSSVAKDPSNLSNYFSKTLALTISTTDIYVMPEGEVMYWYGYKNPNLQNINTSNGWSSSAGGQSFGTPSFSTNYVVLQGGSNIFTGVGLSTARNFNGTHHLISKGQANSGLSKTTGNNKQVVYESSHILTPSSNSNITHQQTNYSGNTNVVASGRKASDNTITMYAWWAETA